MLFHDGAADRRRGAPAIGELSDVMRAAAPAVALLHGWGGSVRTTWQPLGWEAEIAAAGREPLAIDVLGHGEAPAPHEPEAYADLVRHTGRALNGHEVIDVIAFSLGAKLTLALAADHPHRFRRIIIAGVFRPGLVGALAESLHVGVSESAPEHLREYVAYAFGSRNDVRALSACLQRAWTPLSPDQPARIRQPVLVVLGDHDRFAGAAAPLIDALPDGRLLTLPGVGPSRASLLTPISRRRVGVPDGGRGVGRRGSPRLPPIVRVIAFLKRAPDFGVAPGMAGSSTRMQQNE